MAYPPIKSQKDLITAIRKEQNAPAIGENPSSWRTSVHFVPSIAQFTYDDTPVKEEVIIPLVESGTLFFKGMSMHQGERCPRYNLA